MNENRFNWIWAEKNTKKIELGFCDWEKTWQIIKFPLEKGKSAVIMNIE